ncbi:MFS transporter [Janthinobacterium sp. AD80]|uniref:MFS transporter n=1 Tax=Janthinobacterium sp. AD80 TaxID=1528773 RepID=UPI000C83C07A|nr:MFS transporter [Janthinobacterium sp. AD80]
MTLCVFTLIASEFMPVSLLTPLAADLRVSEGLVGYGIAISGAFAVLASLSISTLAASMNRKTLLLLLTGLMCVSALVVGLATSYAMYMAGRALIGVVVGGFWSMSVAVAMRLVPKARVPRALAIFNGGNALATVVAAPLGSYLGGSIGWRGAFLCLVPVALLALAWQWFSLPSMPAAARVAASGNVFKLLRNRLVALGMLAVGMFFMGQFVLFTYVRPFLESVTRVGLPTLSMILLVIGLAGVVGTALIGTFLRRGLYRTLVAIPLLMAVIALCLVAFGGAVAPVFVLLGLWGMLATAAPTGWWSWLAQVLPGDAEAGGGLMVAVVQLCIACGSTVGGILADGHGLRATFMASAALLLLASLLAWRTARLHGAQAR